MSDLERTSSHKMARTMRYCRPKTSAPETLLEYLSKRFDYLPLEKWIGYIETGVVTVNGATVSPHLILKQQDMVSFDPPRELEPEVNTAFAIAYEDADVLVVSKSGNIPVSEGGRYSKNTLVKVLEEFVARRRVSGGERLDETSLPPLYAGHRLDKETSGLVAFAKTASVATRLCESFGAKAPAAGKTQAAENEDGEDVEVDTAVSASATIKEYEAVVAGELRDQRVVNLRIGFAVECVPVDQQPKGKSLAKLRMKAYPEDSPYGKAATSIITPVVSKMGLTFVRVRILTGRTHQIRVHCAAIGFPILGEKLYDGDVSDELYLRRTRGEEPVLWNGSNVIPRHMLHCAKLVFRHPRVVVDAECAATGLVQQHSGKVVPMVQAASCSAYVFVAECPFLSELFAPQ